jgi:hypothetical protein
MRGLCIEKSTRKTRRQGFVIGNLTSHQKISSMHACMYVSMRGNTFCKTANAIPYFQILQACFRYLTVAHSFLSQCATGTTVQYYIYIYIYVCVCVCT